MTITMHIDRKRFHQFFRLFERASLFSAAGLDALFDFFEAWSCDHGRPWQLDVHGVAADYTQFSDPIAAASAVGWTPPPADLPHAVQRERARTWLRSHVGTVLEFPGGVIVSRSGRSRR